MTDNNKSKVKSVLSKEQLDYYQNSNVSSGSGNVVELDWDGPETIFELLGISPRKTDPDLIAKIDKIENRLIIRGNLISKRN